MSDSVDPKSTAANPRSWRCRLQAKIGKAFRLLACDRKQFWDVVALRLFWPFQPFVRKLPPREAVGAFVRRRLDIHRWRRSVGKTPDASPHAGGLIPGRVSVVLPVYNQADMLAESIQSVLRQTYEDFELIIVNDGSRDGVERALAPFHGHPKIRVLSQTNQKLPKALTNGFEFARGEFWTWTSADNVMAPEQLERQVSFLRERPEVAMVYCDYLAIDDAGRPLLDREFRPQNRNPPSSPAIRLPRSTAKLNVVQDNFIGACFMYRGLTGLQLGEYDPALGVEDYDYWMRINALSRIEHLGADDLLYLYRVHANTLNARAKQLGILERVAELMRHDQARRTFYKSRFRVHADARTRHWLRGGLARGVEVVPWDPSQPIAGDGTKSILLIAGESLPDLARSPIAENVAIVAWEDRDPLKLLTHRVTLAEKAWATFVADRHAAARVALIHPLTFVAEPGAKLLELLWPFANDRLFQGRRRAADVRRRIAPEPFWPADRPMRVLLQVDQFTNGGLEQVVIDLAEALGDHGVEVSLLALGKLGPAMDHARQRGVRVLTLPERGREEAYRQLLVDEGVDIVNAHYSAFGAQIADELGRPFVQTIHNCYVWYDVDDVLAFRDADRHTAAYLCVSTNVAWYASHCFGVSANKMIVAPNGVDLRPLRQASKAPASRGEFGWGPDDFVFLNVSSIHAPKAQTFLVEAMAQVVASAPHARLALIGGPASDKYYAQVMDAIQEHDLSQHVRVLGRREDVATFYPLADALVMPSFWEGWSLAMTEATVAGLPIIATDVGSARELLAMGEGAIVQPPFDSLMELHAANIETWLRGRHPGFVEELADQMRTMTRSERRAKTPLVDASALDRERAYALYLRVYRWALQGGDARSARAWLRLPTEPMRRAERRAA